MRVKYLSKLLFLGLFLELVFVPKVQATMSVTPDFLGNPLGQGTFMQGRYVNEHYFARSVWDMQSFDNKIYFGAGDYDTNQGPIDLYYYDLATTSFGSDLIVNQAGVTQTYVMEEEINKFKVVDGTLWTVGVDAQEDQNFGNIYRYDGNGVWSKFRTIPKGVHVFDIIDFNGKMYVSLGTGDLETATIVESSDGGQTFTPVFGALPNIDSYNRMYNLFEFNNTLYSSYLVRNNSENSASNLPETSIYKLNGSSFEKHSIAGSNLIPGADPNYTYVMGKPTNFNSNLVFFLNNYSSGGTLLYKTSDMEHGTLINLGEGINVNDILVKEEKLYVLASKWNTNNSFTNYVFSTSDLNNWDEVLSFNYSTYVVSFEEVDGDFYFGAGTGFTSFGVGSSANSGDILKVDQEDYLGYAKTPAIESINGTVGVAVSGPSTALISISNLDTGSSVAVLDNGTQIEAKLAVGTTDTITISNLASWAHSLVIRVTNVAGNSTSSSTAVVYTVAGASTPTPTPTLTPVPTPAPFEFTNPTEIIKNIGATVPQGPYFASPVGTAVDSHGNIYVADYGNNLIQKYDLGTSTWTTMGTQGTAPGQFNTPSEVAIDSHDNIYVADTDNHRIQIFDVSTSTWTTMGTQGTAPGQFRNPTGVAIDTTGNIYTIEKMIDRIQKYDVGTRTWSIIQIPSVSDDTFFNRTLKLDKHNNIYYVDSLELCIHKYNIGTTSWEVIEGIGTLVGWELPQGVDIDSYGNIYATVTSITGKTGRLEKYDIGTSTWTVIGTYGTAPGQFRGPNRVDIDSNNNIYVSDTGNNRIQKFDIGTSTWTALGSNSAILPGMFSTPRGVSVNTNGDIYITESGNNRIQKYDVGTTTWTVMGSQGTAPGQFNLPSGIALDSNNNIYVADSNNNRIQKFDIGTDTWTVMGSKGTAPGQFNKTSGIAIDSHDNIYVAESNNNRIQKYDIGTTTWTIMGSQGTAPGQFKWPSGIAIDSHDNIYVADSNNNRIQKFDIGTDTWTVMGAYGTAPGQFWGLSGIALDSNNNIYVAESTNNRIQKYDIGTDTWIAYGSNGSGLGQFNQTSGIAIDSHDNIYVADSNNNRIQKFWYYHLTNYSSSNNGSITGLNSQKLSIGQSGTQVVAVGNSGYAFLEWSDGSIANPRTDVGGAIPITVSAAFTNTRSFNGESAPDIQSEVTRSFISIGSTNPSATPNFTFNINYTFLAGSANIVFPAQTVATPVGTSTVDLTQFRTIDNTTEIQTSLDRTLKSIQIGIPNSNLTFSIPITITIPVGTNYNNQTLQVVFQREGDTSWSDETTCLIINGDCTFQTTHATTFTVLKNISQPSTNNNNYQPVSNTPDNNCHSSKPLSISDLFQIDTTSNKAKIYFTPQTDTSEYFISFSSVNKNGEEHGERVTLLREGVQSHTIYSLKPNTTYYVKVRGQNGCMPGDWSNTMTFKTNSKIYYRYSPLTKSNISGDTKSNINTKLPIKETHTTIQKIKITTSPPPSTESSSSSVNPQPIKQVVPNPAPVPKKKCFLWWCW